MEHYLKELFHSFGVPLAGFYYCPHHPQGSVKPYAVNCDCRKPKPGLLLRAAKEKNIDLEKSWFIGDILNDIEAGRVAGCKTILLDNGHETEWQLSLPRVPHAIARNIHEAANVIDYIKRN